MVSCKHYDVDGSFSGLFGVLGAFTEHGSVYLGLIQLIHLELQTQTVSVRWLLWRLD